MCLSSSVSPSVSLSSVKCLVLSEYLLIFCVKSEPQLWVRMHTKVPARGCAGVSIRPEVSVVTGFAEQLKDYN